jgi:hypothetical protein
MKWALEKELAEGIILRLKEIPFESWEADAQAIFASIRRRHPLSARLFLNGLPPALSPSPRNAEAGISEKSAVGGGRGNGKFPQ